MSFYHDRACKGSASSSRPRTGRDHHGAVWYDRPRLLSLHDLPLSTEHTKDVPSDILPLPSATACCNHACCCSPCHHGAVLHAPRSTVHLSASDIRDKSMDASVSLASFHLLSHRKSRHGILHGRCERIGKTPPYGNIKRSVSAPFLFCHLNHSRCKLKSQYTLSTPLVNL